jgi:ABC transporter with metal-binding/Fe-S-binding domain ATP-binding protein
MVDRMTPKRPMNLGVLFSGGKDSAYACHAAMQRERVSCLISVIARNEESYMFHTPNIRLVSLQAEASGLPLVEVETAGEEETELADLRRAIEMAVDAYGIDGVVTGAILSIYQATRIQRICRDLDLWCFNPLWHADQRKYLERLVDAGFRVLISGVFSEPFDASWLGRIIDRETIGRLRTIAERSKITITGEGGEYETFVLDAPYFQKRIEVVKAERTFRNYNGRYRIDRARLVDK